MAAVNYQPPLSGLPRRLVKDGVVNEETISKSIAEAQSKKLSLISHLVQAKLAQPAQVASSAAQEFGLALVDLAALDPEQFAIDAVNPMLIEKHRALPLFRRGNKLFVAIADPTNIGGLDEIKFATGLSTEPVLAEENKLKLLIEKASTDTDFAMAELGDTEGLENVDVGKLDDTDEEIEDTPVVRFVNKVLLDGIKRGASDIHLEPYEKTYRVRYRVDGMLMEIAAPPLSMQQRISARVKVMSRMDISERRVPQDGRIKMKISKQRAVDFRVSTLPTLFGEKIVMRILDPSSARLGIDALGYEEDQKQLYLDALANPYGMILVTGPTGSGKTVSLYTGLNILNTADRNISTAEDPAEINMPGINQVNVNTKVGLGFSEALKAFLRQDPDVIMVGEIRDLETANIAIKAAQTGHLVLSTLHTNDAPQTLTRLLNMGVPAFNIASSVSLIIAQRLARRLCEDCKQKDEIPPQALLGEGFKETELESMMVYKAVGCDQCSGTGHKGRVGIYQVMPVNEDIGRIIMSNGNSMQLAEQASRDGIADLRSSALKKVRDGVISLAEANRVTKD